MRKIIERRLPGIASAARTRLREEFGCIVFLKLSVGIASNVYELEQHARPPDVLEMWSDRGGGSGGGT